MQKHKIIWTEDTWNPYPGCDKVSDGCKHCYAIIMANRLAHIPATRDVYKDLVKKTQGGELNWTGMLAKNHSQFTKPLTTKNPTIFFTQSMGDLFHDLITFEQIDEIFDIMNACPHHTFQVLTKRPGSAMEYFQWKKNGRGYHFELWPLANVWMGTSVENQRYAEERIPKLLSIPAVIHFLSCEPLLGPVDLEHIFTAKGTLSSNYISSLTGYLYTIYHKNRGGGTKQYPAIDWVIAGGESGHDSRPMHPTWVRNIRNQCRDANVPFLFKQWGDWVPLENPDVIKGKYARGWGATSDWKYAEYGFDNEEPTGETWMKRVGKHAAGNTLDGQEHIAFPEHSRTINVASQRSPNSGQTS